MNGNIRIIIHATVNQLIIRIKNGIIISLRTGLYADKFIFYGKCHLLRLFHLKIRIVPLRNRYIFLDVLLIGSRH